MADDPTYRFAAGYAPVSRQLLDDACDLDLHAIMTAPPVYGPPPPGPHPSHRIDSEDGDCLLCNVTDSDRLAEECSFEVVPRRTTP